MAGFFVVFVENVKSQPLIFERQVERTVMKFENIFVELKVFELKTLFDIVSFVLELAKVSEEERTCIDFFLMLVLWAKRIFNKHILQLFILHFLNFFRFLPQLFLHFYWIFDSFILFEVLNSFIKIPFELLQVKIVAVEILLK